MIVTSIVAISVIVTSIIVISEIVTSIDLFVYLGHVSHYTTITSELMDRVAEWKRFE